MCNSDGLEDRAGRIRQARSLRPVDAKRPTNNEGSGVPDRAGSTPFDVARAHNRPQLVDRSPANRVARAG